MLTRFQQSKISPFAHGIDAEFSSRNAFRYTNYVRRVLTQISFKGKPYYMYIL